MKNVCYVLVFLISLFVLSSCESESIENDISIEQEIVNNKDSSLNISAIDKEDAETVGTKD